MSDLKVIGGEFAISLDSNTNEPVKVNRLGISDRYYYSAGRTALYAILNDIINIKKECVGVLVPDYICASVTKTIRDIGCDFLFYQIGRDLLPAIESLYAGLRKEKVVLLVNYFGVVDLAKVVLFIRKKFKDAIIIIDDVQNYYGFGSIDGFDYAFTSFRKWFPVPDGAEVIARNKQPCGSLIKFKKKNEFAQYKLAGNILKNFTQEIGDDICLDLIEKGEKILNENYCCKGTNYSLAMMEKFNKKDYARKRKENARILHEGLDEIGIINIYREDIVPLFVPIVLNNRTEIRKKLWEHNIFCPIHWHYESEVLQGKNSLYDLELSLICDQRYDENDMKLILEILKHEYSN